MNDVIETNLPTDRIDEMPTRPSAQKARVVSIATAMLAGLGIGFWYYGPAAYASFLDDNAAAAIHLNRHGFSALLSYGFIAFGVLGGLCGVTGLVSFWRTTATYQMLRAVLLLVYPATLGYAALAWVAIFSLAHAEVAVGGEVQSRAVGVLFWWSLSWPALAVALYAFWLHVMLQSRSVYAAFTRQGGTAMRGDRILENWRTHGRDPRQRKSFYASFATHIVILILIPFMLQFGGCVEAFNVPKGSGNPVVALVQIVKPKKKKKKTLTLRPNSAIIFEIPDLDDTEVDRQMDEMTQARYEARVNAKAGQMGAGGGDTGGWPEGSEDFEMRFVRLKHDGKGWDDGMGESDADVNFMRAFARATPFKKVRSRGEAHSIAMLAKYPDDGFPPFVYLTGNGRMGRTTPRDREILREYCLKGGMLIADAGSRDFDRSFRSFIGQVFNDKPLLDIADDEMIYQLPYGFPNGAPAFWHHGGRRALGIKHEGRWVVFYHPGDMGDAWKSRGYSDVTPEMREAAFQLGINLVYYAFTQWNDAVAKIRK